METNIREYNEEAPVEIIPANEAYGGSGVACLLKYFKGDKVKSNRLVIIASNECGNNTTCVDLLDVLKWCYENGISIVKEGDMSHKVTLETGKGNVEAELIEKKNGFSLLKLIATNAVVAPDGDTCMFDSESSARNYYNKIVDEPLDN